MNNVRAGKTLRAPEMTVAMGEKRMTSCYILPKIFGRLDYDQEPHIEDMTEELVRFAPMVL